MFGNKKLKETIAALEKENALLKTKVFLSYKGLYDVNLMIHQKSQIEGVLIGIEGKAWDVIRECLLQLGELDGKK